MSATLGHVTRKDGRIVELPETVRKFLPWLAGVALVTPGIMLLTGLFTPRSVLPAWAGILLGILPIGIILTALVMMLREGKWGNMAFASVLCVMNYFAMTIEPHTEMLGEVLLVRGVPILCIVIALWLFRLDLHYNLRALWYSMQAMKEMQQQMANMKAARDAKKRGESFDPGKIIDAEAMVREAAAKTGREVPAHMAGGFNMRPGFRQNAKDESRKGSASASKQRKQR